jgi:S-adenosylmethionine hydrolase
MPIVTLTTDFGTRDYYAGALKGVILSIAPKAVVIDITHDIEPHDVSHGAFVLWQNFGWYPLGTIHLAVVDPGVGSERRIIVGRYAGRYVVAPDNGLVTLVHRETLVEGVHVVQNRRYFLTQLSNTFHGRDIMAPVAAHLANGVKHREFGPVTDRLEMLGIAHRADRVGKAMRGGVLHVDRFGTLVTNIRCEQLTAPPFKRSALEVFVNDENVGPVRPTFSAAQTGKPVAFIGGSGLLEIAVNKGRAIDRFGPREAIRVEVRQPPPEFTY